MDSEIINDITDYIDFLRSVGFCVSVSIFDKAFNRHLKILLEYEVHQPLICSYLKSNSSTVGRCSRNKLRLRKKHPKKPYYSCCYAGVEEFVIPIVFGSKSICCINISGYRSKMPQSRFLSQRISNICDSRFDRLYEKLSQDVPEMKSVLKFVTPLYYMFIELYKKCSANITAETPAETLYRKTMNFVYDNYMNDISCKSIAQNMNYSESYLRHSFMKTAGISLSGFINSVRLDKAKELLKYSGLSVAQVAQNTGFCDSNYFSTVFKKAVGVTPSKYRYSHK